MSRSPSAAFLFLVALWLVVQSAPADAQVFADRVRETTTTTGTGTVNLDGAVTSYRTFVTGIGTGNVTYYCIVHRTAAEWECGSGTVTDATPDTLSRTMLSSSTGSAVSFSAGTKDAFSTVLGAWYSSAATRSGSPASGRVAVFTSATAITGDAGMTYDTATDTLGLRQATSTGPNTGVSPTMNVTSLTGPTASLEFSDTATNTIGLAFSLKHTTSGNMVDGFGVGMEFLTQDSSAAPFGLASIYAQRDGADNTGRLRLLTTIAGSQTDRLVIGSTGAVTIPNLASAGTTMVTATAAGLLGTAAIPGGTPTTTAVVAADVTVTNTLTLANATGLTVSVCAVSTEVWQIELSLLTSATSTNSDWKFGWTFPTGMTMFWAPHANVAAAGNGYFDPNVTLTGNQLALLTQTAQPTYAASVVTGGFFFRGWVVCAGTPGTLQFQFAQAQSASATNLVIKKGSLLLARKVVP